MNGTILRTSPAALARKHKPTLAPRVASGCMKPVAFWSAIVLTGLISGAAHAESAADAEPATGVSTSTQPGTPSSSTEPTTLSDWEFQVLLYGWASAIDARVEAGGVTSDPSASFGDLLKNLKWAIEGAGEVRYQRALLILDLIGAQLKVGSESNALTIPFDPPPPGGSSGALTVGPIKGSVRTTLWIFDVKPGWRLLSLPVSDVLRSESADDPRKLDVDVFTGIRYWNMKNSVRMKISPGSLTIDGMTIGLGGLDIPDIDFGDITLPGVLLTGGTPHITKRVDWVDWIFASRIRADLTEHVAAFLIGDVGGFGIGSSSRLTWQVAAGFNWAFAEHFSLVLAYRALGVDRSSAIEGILHGPMLGLGLRF